MYLSPCYYRKRPSASFGPNRSVGRRPHEARLRSRSEDRGFPRASSADSGLQIGIGQVHPSRSRFDPPETHPVNIRTGNWKVFRMFVSTDHLKSFTRLTSVCMCLCVAAPQVATQKSMSATLIDIPKEIHGRPLE